MASVDAEAKEGDGSGGGGSVGGGSSGSDGEHSGGRGGWVTRGNNHEVVEFCYAPTPWPTAVGDARALVATADVNAATTANAADELECGVGGAAAGGAADIASTTAHAFDAARGGAGAAAGAEEGTAAGEAFRSTLEAFYDESSAVGGALLGCVAEALGLDRGHFAAAASPGEVRRERREMEREAWEPNKQREGEFEKFNNMMNPPPSSSSSY